MWHVGPTHNTLITAGNGGTKNATVSFGLRFDEGKRIYELPDRDLAPGQQMWVDVGKLIRNQVPDKNGLLLPSGLEHGSYEFKDVNNPILGYLYEGKLVLDKTYGQATYGCGCCCPTYNTWMDPWYLFLPGQTGQASIYAERVCTGTINVTGSAGGWWTGNSSVGGVSGTGLENGVGPGNSSVSASLNYTGPHPESGNCECTEFTAYPESGMTVEPNPYQVQPINTVIQGAALCPGGQNGWSRTVTNQLQNASGQAIAISGISMTDTLTIQTPNSLGVSGTVTGNTTTNSNGSFPDTYFVCSAACPSSATGSALQSWTYNNLGLPHVNGVSYSCSAITVDGR
jgi:hypothetical protein